jgi:hypothetical protein
LRVMDLPGMAPPDFTPLEAKVHDHGIYTHNEGSEDEWSLTWKKVDGDSEVNDYAPSGGIQFVTVLLTSVTYHKV